MTAKRKAAMILPEIPLRSPKQAALVSKVYLLDKPAGKSSFAALGALKRAISTKKVGHAGTLDPFATGLLIAASGKLTKIAGLLTDLDKEYEAVFRFGQETDTLDTEGDVIASAPVPELDDINAALPGFCGTVVQRPPAYSAVKINGKRAYARARDGQDIQMPERHVKVYEFEILHWKKPDLRVRIRCSKGTYIRSLARDLGLAAGSRAFCAELRRTGIGPFGVDEACDAETVEEGHGLGPLEFFGRLGIPIVEISDSAGRELRSGVPFRRIKGFPGLDSTSVLFVNPDKVPCALVRQGSSIPEYHIVFDS